MKNQKGITLIALIITIIVMLILVGVSVTVALNSGLFSAAQKAAKNTQEERVNETALSEGNILVDENRYGSLEEYVQSIGGAGSSGVALPENLGVGDIITGYVPASKYTSSKPYDVSTDYAGCTGTFYTEMGEGVEWKVIAVTGNTMEIIPNAVSSTMLTLRGANGWNNSEKAIESVCKAIYGNEESELYTAKATGLTLKDINGIAGYTEKESTTSYSPSQYGSNNKFPTEYLKENGITDYTGETNGYAISTSTNKFIKQTEYGYNNVESQKNFNPKFAGWVDIDKTYWLASRCVSAVDNCARFRVSSIRGGWYRWLELDVLL